MKFLICSVLLLLSTTVFGKSNIAASWIDQDQTLSIQIVDDPAAGPFVAGEIWQSIRGTGANKQVKTDNMELSCAGSNRPDGTSFGDCNIRVALNRVLIQPTKINFAISKTEAQSALANFEEPFAKDSILIKSGSTDVHGDDLFIFEISWRHQMIAALLSRSLVSE